MGDVPLSDLLSTYTQLFGTLVDSCFNACVNDFTSKAVSERENGCVSRCVQKYMASGQRLSERFQEHNAEMATKSNTV